MKRLGTLLEEAGGEYFADGRLTMADLKAFLFVRHQKSGNLDHIPTGIVDDVSPTLAKHFERIKNDAGVRAYYEKVGAPG